MQDCQNQLSEKDDEIKAKSGNQNWFHWVVRHKLHEQKAEKLKNEYCM